VMTSTTRGVEAGTAARRRPLEFCMVKKGSSLESLRS
jgi:hypothetical protein